MTAKEKATELVSSFKPFCGGYVGERINKQFAKECSLIMVKELINQQEGYNNGSFYPNYFWQEVKQELDKL
jgi:hypothetical protein